MDLSEPDECEKSWREAVKAANAYDGKLQWQFLRKQRRIAVICK
ncbi:MAG: hypothetical protein ACLRZZ_05935 [Enterocloster sp.]